MFYYSDYSLFYLILLPPPRSTLFPYTTLFRSGEVRLATAGELARGAEPQRQLGAPLHRRAVMTHALHRDGMEQIRSEEHTSELQSHVNLVCRLLLEKKKKQTIKLK